MNKQSTILIMDEDPETLEQLQTTLQRAGYNVLVAVDGHAALRLAHSRKPDLIVSDLLLTGLDSYQVWKAFRADKENVAAPILVISALNIPASNEPWRPSPNAEWQLLSYDAFLPKPIDLRRFLRVVQKLLAPAQTQTIASGPSTILAIEDKETQRALASILSNNDFGVETPASLSEALQLSRAVPPAALLVDCRTRSEATKNFVVQTRRFVPNTVIIALIDPQGAFEEGLESLCDSFLAVPLHPTRIVLSINRILDHVGMKHRTRAISNQLITTNQDLLDTQQVLRAQNEELQHINNQLRELSALKETLTGMIVHDLKAPLGAVLGAINFLITDPDLNLTSTHARLLTAANAAGDQLLRLTETLLEGQRLEDGHLKPDIEPFELPALIDVSLHRVSPLLTMSQLEVQYTFADNLPTAFADPHISQRIVENLLDNAIKFSPPRSAITINVTSDGKMITVSITDQGPGIPKDRQQEIFDRFAQIKNAASPSTRAGFGLGLTFCNLATQAMGGSIWVESDGESGTTFLFTLPVYEDETTM
ncbi:MAG: response regulator [Anaerolineales bacterium]|nr:response regulator [Anaerolineales bacterium]